MYNIINGVKKKKKFFTVKFSSIVPFKERRGVRERRITRR